ncbi:MAG TPA: phosphate regulon sensor histidine kinase PhoR [Burkholderiales bacterium]|nr:phosphate regulon sensor histidine kinase PhoR [Burkholderiales bacterium]
MSDFWQRNLILAVLLLLAAFLGGLAAGTVNGVLILSAGLALMLGSHLRQMARLEAWLRQPGAPVPDARGTWGELFYRLGRMLRRQSESRELLSLALDRFLQVTAAMPDGVVVLDETDRVVLCNPAAEQHLGLDAKQDLGQQITYLVRAPQFSEFLGAGQGEPLVIRLPRDLGRVLSVQIVPYGARQKLILSRDITRLEKLETMRRDFIANVSHELRTPLTVVGGFLETLSEAEHPDPAMTHRAMTLMADQTRRMQRLVDDLLTLSRLENEREAPREEEVDVPSLARVLYHEAQSLSGGKHEVALRLESDLWVQGAAEELRSAFSNLVTNAVRYTPEGGRVSLAWEQAGAEGVFSVTDSGIGIEADHIPRLTERFYRVDRSRSRETGGTGLGLAIVKHVVNRHGARLEIASQPGRGSRFSVWFPESRLRSPPAASAAARA